MDECLVLLADLMCWPLHKVASLLLNGRQIERKVSKSKIVKNRQKLSKIVKNKKMNDQVILKVNKNQKLKATFYGMGCYSKYLYLS